MAKRGQMKNVRLEFSEEEHQKLLRKKGATGLTWEEWILRIAGVETE